MEESTLAPAAETPATAKKILVFDFDETFTDKHTLCAALRNINAAEEIKTEEGRQRIRANIRDPDWLADYLRRAVNAGYTIAIATFHPNEEHVRAYMKVLLGDNYNEVIRYFCCQNPYKADPDGKHDKNGHIEIIKKELGLEDIPPANVRLIDDTVQNIEAAETAGYKATLASKDLWLFKRALENILTPATRQSLQSSSSDEGFWRTSSNDSGDGGRSPIIQRPPSPPISSQ